MKSHLQSMALWKNKTATVNCWVVGANGVGKNTLINILTGNRMFGAGNRMFGRENNSPSTTTFYSKLPGDKAPTCFTMHFAKERHQLNDEVDVIIMLYDVNLRDTLLYLERVDLDNPRRVMVVVLGLKTDLVPRESTECPSYYEVHKTVMAKFHCEHHFTISCVKSKQWIRKEFKRLLLQHAVHSHCKRINKTVQEPEAVKVGLTWLDYNADTFKVWKEWLDTKTNFITAALVVYLALHFMVIIRSSE